MWKKNNAAPDEQAAIMGSDLRKAVFQVHGVRTQDRVARRKQPMKMIAPGGLARVFIDLLLAENSVTSPAYGNCF